MPAVAFGLVLSLTGCGSPRRVGPASAPAAAFWKPFLHVPFVVDLTPPRRDGRFTIAADGRLFLLGPTVSLVPFARGAGGYSTVLGPEPYIALVTGAPVAGAGCSFVRDTVYALEVTKAPGVISVDARGQTRRIANLPGVGGIDERKFLDRPEPQIFHLKDHAGQAGAKDLRLGERRSRSEIFF